MYDELRRSLVCRVRSGGGAGRPRGVEMDRAGMEAARWGGTQPQRWIVATMMSRLTELLEWRHRWLPSVVRCYGPCG